MEILISHEIREMTPSAPDTLGIEGQMLRSKGYRIGARVRWQLTRVVWGVVSKQLPHYGGRAEEHFHTVEKHRFRMYEGGWLLQPSRSAHANMTLKGLYTKEGRQNDVRITARKKKACHAHKASKSRISVSGGATLTTGPAVSDLATFQKWSQLRGRGEREGLFCASFDFAPIIIHI